MEEVDESVGQPRQGDYGDPEGEGGAVKVAELQDLPVVEWRNQNVDIPDLSQSRVSGLAISIN